MQTSIPLLTTKLPITNDLNQQIVHTKNIALDLWYHTVTNQPDATPGPGPRLPNQLNQMASQISPNMWHKPLDFRLQQQGGQLDEVCCFAMRNVTVQLCYHFVDKQFCSEECCLWQQGITVDFHSCRMNTGIVLVFLFW